jgi:phosphoribosylaminoimidazolecarboxamide formyltransferase/IMP cyclohydrolase
VLQGKELSYNNLLDLDAAMRLAAEFPAPAVVIVKHGNPCGAAVSEKGLSDAYRRARETDPVSAYGGIVAVNRPVDGDLGRELGAKDMFFECVIAPGFSPEAREALAGKKNLRLLTCAFDGADAESSSWGPSEGPQTPPRRTPLGEAQLRPRETLELRSVAGGLLVQTRDAVASAASAGRVVSKRAPTPAELRDLDFAWRVCKHVKSNAIVFAKDGCTVGIGAGQMSRVDSVKIAVSKARDAGALRGSVIASDAFFPFRDGVDEAARAGAVAAIQPGGSVRDQDAIAAADEHGMAMVLTGERHFRH